MEEKLYVCDCVALVWGKNEADVIETMIKELDKLRKRQGSPNRKDVLSGVFRVYPSKNLTINKNSGFSFS